MSFFSSRISIRDKVLFYESIANLLDGGVSLVASLQGFHERLPEGTLKEGVDNTLFFVKSGDHLATAMRKLPNIYSEKEIAIIESGEQTGMLKDTFSAVAQEFRMQEDLRRNVTNALTYPFIILVFLVLAVSVVMAYVIPSIMPTIAEMSTELSFSTKSLMFVSDFLSNNIFLIVGFFITILLLFRGFIFSDLGHMWWDRYKIFNMITGRVYKNYIIVQIMATFHLLSSSGVSIVKALRLTGKSSGNTYIELLYNTIADDVAQGKKISESMIEHDKEHYIFTPDIIQLIESAEKTSNVHQVAQKISQQYQRELEASLAILVKFIEPTALLGAGLFVLWFALAIFSVIMSITKSVNF